MPDLWYALGAFVVGVCLGALAMRLWVRWWFKNRFPSVVERAFDEALAEYLAEQGEAPHHSAPCRCRPVRRNGRGF